jgi:hypothetical protein
MMNANWFQIVMLAYNLNCWLQLFSREENVTVKTMKHTTLAQFVCASCSWLPESGDMQAELASATATITRRKERFSGS